MFVYTGSSIQLIFIDPAVTPENELAVLALMIICRAPRTRTTQEVTTVSRLERCEQPAQRATIVFRNHGQSFTTPTAVPRPHIIELGASVNNAMPRPISARSPYGGYPQVIAKHALI